MPDDGHGPLQIISFLAKLMLTVLSQSTSRIAEAGLHDTLMERCLKLRRTCNVTPRQAKDHALNGQWRHSPCLLQMTWQAV